MNDTRPFPRLRRVLARWIGEVGEPPRGMHVHIATYRSAAGAATLEVTLFRRGPIRPLASTTFLESIEELSPEDVAADAGPELERIMFLACLAVGPPRDLDCDFDV